MERDLVADAERNEAVQPRKRCVARGPVDDIALAEKKAREISAVLPGYAGDEGHLARRPGYHDGTRYMAVYLLLELFAPQSTRTNSAELLYRAIQIAGVARPTVASQFDWRKGSGRTLSFSPTMNSRNRRLSVWLGFQWV